MHTNMLLSSLPYLEPSTLLLYLLNFPSLPHSAYANSAFQSTVFLSIVSIETLIIRDLHYTLLVLPGFLLTLLPTYLFMTPLLILQYIYFVFSSTIPINHFLLN